MEEGGQLSQCLHSVPVVLQLEVQRLSQLPRQHRLPLPHAAVFLAFGHSKAAEN